MKTIPNQQAFAHTLEFLGEILDMAGAYIDIGPDQLEPGKRPPRRLKYDSKASKLFTDYQRQCVEHQKKSIRGGDVWTRSARKAATYAILHAMSRDPNNRKLDGAAMEWGIEVQRRLTQHLGEYLAKWCSATPFDRRQKALLRKIQQRGGWMTSRQLIRSSQHLRPRERDELLDNLLETSQLRDLEVKTGKTKARLFYEPKTIRKSQVLEAFNGR